MKIVSVNERCSHTRVIAVNVIYVMGYGRSGSTMLDIMLSSHPGVEGLGEVRNLFFEGPENASRGSSFWIEFERYREKIGRQDIVSSGNSLQIEGLFRGCLVRSSEQNEYANQQCEFFTDLSNFCEKTTFVDSSKTTSGSTWRPLCLNRTGIKVFPVLLWRSLPEIYAATQRGTNRDIQEYGRGVSVNVLRLSISWLVSNIAALVQLRKMDCGVVIFYGDLVRDHNTYVKRILLENGLLDYQCSNDYLVGNQAFGNRITNDVKVKVRPLKEEGLGSRGLSMIFVKSINFVWVQFLRVNEKYWNSKYPTDAIREDACDEDRMRKK